jgi:hypothetical protein
MYRQRVHRLTTAFLVVLSLLFSQLALANYVCLSPQAGERVAMEMAPGQPCEGMDMGMQMDEDQPVLCHQHCVNAPQSADPVQVPVVSLPAVVHAHVVEAVADIDATAWAGGAAAARPRPPPDPLFLSTLRLRV